MHPSLTAEALKGQPAPDPKKIDFNAVLRQHPGAHVLSHPSTIPDGATSPNPMPEAVIEAQIEESMKVDYAPVYLSLFPSATYDEFADLLDPPDSYPYLEYEDFDHHQQAMVLGCRVAWAVEHHNMRLEEQPKKDLAWALDRVPDFGLNQWDATTKAADLLRKAWKESEGIRATVAKANDGRPKPARPGHLMAEGGVLQRVKGMVRDGSAYGRKVIFDEPVNAFTMLYGDRIAVGGDMLTGCTITDTVEYTDHDHAGRTRTRYSAKAVSL